MSDDRTIAEIMATWRERIDAGEAVDIEALIVAHPEHEEALRAQFAAVQILDLAVLETFDGAVDPEALPDRAEIGPYRLLRILGRGGMGRVYLAQQEEPIRRQVALKVLVEELRDTKARARFEVEREALALMDHPYIAPVYDAGIAEDGTPYVAMAYVDGVPITTFCEQEALDLSGRLELFAKVCDAVQHAHQKGVVHRDLKPANVMVSIVDGRAVPRVIDFGLAKGYGGALGPEADLTLGGQILGTPAYMSPEQAGGTGVVDVRTDVYALGVLLYELLTGRVPWGRISDSGSNMVRMIRRILEEEPPTPSTQLSASGSGDAASPTLTTIRRRDLRGDLDWIVMQAMEKEPDRRYPSAQALGDDVRRHLRSEPVSAGPPSATYRLGKFVARHRTAVAASAFILATMLGALVVSVHNVRKARAAHEASEAAQHEAEDLLVFMMDDLAEGLSALNRLDLLSEIDERAIAYYDARRRGGADAASRRRVAHALQRIGRTRLQQGDTDRALSLARDVLAMAGEDPEMALERSDAHFVMAVASRAKGDLAGAESGLVRRLETLALLEAETSPPVVALRRFEALWALGSVRESAGRRPEAAVDYQRALDLARTELASSGGDDAWQGRAGAASHALGYLCLMQKDFGKARELLGSAVSTFEDLMGRNPAHVRWRAELAGAHDALGLLLATVGEPEAALVHAHRAIEVFDALAAEDPTSTDAESNRLKARVHAANALLSVGRVAEGRKHLEDAVALADALVERDPTNAVWREQQFHAVFRLGVFHNHSANKDEALQVHARAAALAEDLVALDPENTSRQSFLSSAKQVLVDPLIARGEFDAALAAGRAAVDAARRARAAAPEDVLLRFRVALTLADLARALSVDAAAVRKAVACFDEAEQILNGMREYVAADEAFRVDAALVKLAHGELLLNLRRAREALGPLRDSTAALAALAASAPEHPSYASSLARARGDLAMAEIGSGERAAASSLDHALRAECLQEEGKYADALDQFRLALENPSIRRDHLRAALYNAAAAAALLLASLPDETRDEEREGLRGEALAYLEENLGLRRVFLEEAKASGDEARIAYASELWKMSVRYLRSEDPDLEALRGLPAFQILLESTEQ